MSAEATETHDESELSALGDALEAAAGSISEARSNASVTARAAARRVKSGIGSGAYYTAYGLSYGVVFTGVFLKELLPAENALRRGFEEGAEAAIDAVHTRKARRAGLQSSGEGGNLDEGDLEAADHDEGHLDDQTVAAPKKPAAKSPRRVVKLKEA